MITICETPEKRRLSKPSFMQLQVPFRHTGKYVALGLISQKKKLKGDKYKFFVLCF